MKNVYCKFCNKDLVKSSIEEISHFGMSAYYCNNCNAEYIYFSNNKLASVSLYANINSNLYRFTFPSIGNCQLLHIKDPVSPATRKHKNVQLLLTLKENTNNINPQNINEKIKTWVLFL